ncbi:substrate-binding periplasmic protein [Parachitinimonas caeni]|uniref:Solute-binding protein family 3/N-terminal domain-containing protein n=1 Tax=Parachitinimonas caeni TaxID=3031301 RepID=A0ABT7DZ84_9NEIS|nr:transporter substrate-binding domain-containing protein [Parachitinimonas caeni]MDK2125374.1 hypothetical protein [Parachitinimonas caeni]
MRIAFKTCQTDNHSWHLACRVVLLLACHGLLSPPALAAEPQTIQLVYSDVDVAPLALGKGSEIPSQPGTTVELIQRAVAEAGYKLKLTRLPPLRMLKSLEESEVDGAFVLSYTEERGQKYIYPMLNGKPDSSLRAAHIEYRAYRRTGSTALWNGQTFENLQNPIGANTGWAIVSDLKAKSAPVDDGGADYVANFGKLKLGRIDLFAGLEPSADAYIKLNNIKWVEKVGPPLRSADYFLLFSRGFYASNREAAHKIWQKLAVVREQSENDLYRKYLPAQAKP